MYVFKKGKIQKCNLNYRVSLIYLVFALQTTSHLTKCSMRVCTDEKGVKLLSIELNWLVSQLDFGVSSIFVSLLYAMPFSNQNNASVRNAQTFRMDFFFTNGATEL